MSVTIELALLHQRPETLASLDSDKTYNAQIDLLKQQKGIRAVRIGRAVDKGYESDVHWIVGKCACFLLALPALIRDPRSEWDDKSDHEAFMNDPSYGPFAEAVTGFCTGDPPLELHHIRTTPSRASAVLASHTTEILTVRARQDTDLEAFRAKLEAFRDELESRLGRPALAEPSIEDARQFNVFIGWDSVEQHAKEAQADWFRASLGEMMKIWEQPNMVHVHLKQK